VADDIRALSAQLAQDPQSLVFLRLGEALRRKGQLDAALRVAVNGLERHPHLADAHDLYARILTDKHDYERAFDEWDMAVRIAPHHTGALKGLAFLYFKVGDLEQAEAHLEQARKVEPDDASIDQAIAMMRRGNAPPEPAAPTADSSTVASPTAASPPAAASPAHAPSPGALDETRVFAGLEGANEGLLLIDGAGRVLGGVLKDKAGADVTDTVAAYLAGVSQEAARTAKLLGLGAWMGLSAEGQHGNVHLAHPTPEALLLVVRERGMPLGRLAILAQRATAMARRWLEKQ
jgi:tetratricopeptide (TPR) repeat protein